MSSSKFASTIQKKTMSTPPHSPSIPSWSVVFKRLWTRNDFLHLHGISGGLFLLLSTVFISYYVIQDFVFNQPASYFVQLLNSPWLIIIMVTALVNALTAFPLIRLSTPYYQSADATTKTNMVQVVAFLGAWSSIMYIWQFLRFSDWFPDALQITDAMILLFFIMAVRSFNAFSLFMGQELERNLVGFSIALGIVSSLAGILALFPLLIGGSQWIDHIRIHFPLEPFLYMKFAFYLLWATNLVNFSTTLVSRKIIDYRGAAVVSLLPFSVFFLIVFDFMRYGDLATFKVFSYF